MTGNEIVACIKKHRGKIQMPVQVYEDIAFLYVEKQDAIRHFKKAGSEETHMIFSISPRDGEAYIDTSSHA